MRGAFIQGQHLTVEPKSLHAVTQSVREQQLSKHTAVVQI